MLLRVLEPEVMDSPEEAAEYDAMDFSEPNERFALDALRLIEGVPEPLAIDLGTGTAQIPVRMLEERADLRIVAADLAAHMLELAAARIAARGLGARCELARLDAKAVDRPSASFDLVMSNSTLHHLAEPVLLLREAARLVKPGGALIVRDLLRPESEEEAWSIVEKAAPNDSARQKRLFFESLRAALTLEELRRAAGDAGLSDLEIARISSRHFTLERAGRRGGRVG
jgi:ubiquinone/menaquinone biosynthesis C-methylase UbiE